MPGKNNWLLISIASVGVLVSPATADLTQTGSADVTAAITASSATLTASGTNIYTLTSSSGIHVLNGKIKLDSGAFLEWPDGSVSKSASASAISTFTKFTTDYTTTNTTWTAVPGSTITLVMTGGRALVLFTCPVRAQATFSTPIGLLINGALVDGQHVGSGAAYGGLNSTNIDMDMGGYVHLTESTYSGSTSFAVVFKSSGGTATLNPSTTAACQFTVIQSNE